MKSELGVGTTMRVQLPLRRTPAHRPDSGGRKRLSSKGFLAHRSRPDINIPTASPSTSGSGWRSGASSGSSPRDSDSPPLDGAPFPSRRDLGPATHAGPRGDGAVSPAAASAQPVPPSATDPLPSSKLLIAEDTASSRRLLQSMLERIGGRALLERTHFVVNGREAVELYAKTPGVSLVILDMHMPEMGGLEAMRAIRDIQARERAQLVLSTAPSRAIQSHGTSIGASPHCEFGHDQGPSQQRDAAGCGLSVPSTASAGPSPAGPRGAQPALSQGSDSGFSPLLRPEVGWEPDAAIEAEACPVLALSADAFTDQRDQALESGFSGYLTKPLSLGDLRQLLRQFGFM